MRQVNTRKSNAAQNMENMKAQRASLNAGQPVTLKASWRPAKLTLLNGLARPATPGRLGSAMGLSQNGYG